MNTSVIIPAHNEEQRLAATLALYMSALCQTVGDDFEVIVVANGCTDETARVASEFAALCPQIKVLDIVEPIGKGGAVLAGFREAAGQRILFVDADGATAPESLFDLLAELDEADVVIGSRWMRDSVIRRRQPLQRRALSRLFNASVRGLFTLPYCDTQCGAKAFRRSAARQLAAVVQETRWAFDVDLLLWSRFMGYTVREVPVVWTDQVGSKLRVATTLREVALALWNLKQRNMNSVWDGRAQFAREALL